MLEFYFKKFRKSKYPVRLHFQVPKDQNWYIPQIENSPHIQLAK